MLNSHFSFNWTFVEVQYAVGISDFTCLSFQYIENSVYKFWALPLCYKHMAGQAQPQDLCLRCVFLRILKSSNLLLKQKIKIIPVSMVSEFSSMQKWLTEGRKNWSTNRKKKGYKKCCRLNCLTWTRSAFMRVPEGNKWCIALFSNISSLYKKSPGLARHWKMEL